MIADIQKNSDHALIILDYSIYSYHILLYFQSEMRAMTTTYQLDHPPRIPHMRISAADLQ